jgi:hypothetical protein
VWRPTLEGTLAAYIAHELTLWLRLRTVVVNREVIVRPTDAGDSGERPDIVVDAISASVDATGAPSKVSVPIEIKGSWHEQVASAQDEQLARRYLSAMKSDAGVYLVGWYPLELWDADDDDNKREARRHGSAETLQRMLDEQAAEIYRTRGKRTVPRVIVVARASKTVPSEGS